MSLFLCGDVMTGRGIDQILPSPSAPQIHEPYMTSALGYVELAEHANGPIPRPVEASYPWGDAIAELDRRSPDVRIVNLETAVTASDDWEQKGINYRMSPANVGCLTAAGIDCCVLANNHVLDWGAEGLDETLRTLHGEGTLTAGAGLDAAEARAPARLDVPGRGRVIVLAFGTPSSGIPAHWAAGDGRPGVNLARALTSDEVDRIAATLAGLRRAGDVIVVSVHWGANWGFRVPPEQTAFAHALIDEAGVDIVHGHSSHHPKAVEVYRDRLILYGCGDFLNDYEAIHGHEEFRGDLALMYLVTADAATGRLARLEMVPMQIQRFRLRRATLPDARWLGRTVERESARFETRVETAHDGTLLVAG